MLKGKLNNHKIKYNDIIVFGSVGAGMHINVMVYRYNANFAIKVKNGYTN